jgi:hypothetical protein
MDYKITDKVIFLPFARGDVKPAPSIRGGVDSI